MHRRQLLKDSLVLLTFFPLLGGAGDAQRIPVLYGDGIHDDAPAIRAWSAGKPVRNLQGVLVDPVRIHGQNLLIASPLKMASQERLYLNDCYIKLATKELVVGGKMAFVNNRVDGVPGSMVQLQDQASVIGCIFTYASKPVRL